MKSSNKSKKRYYYITPQNEGQDLNFVETYFAELPEVINRGRGMLALLKEALTDYLKL